MLSLRFSNRYERLADKLATELATEPKSPFDAPLVIVPNVALQQDITRRVADRVGVAANLRFSLPGTWLWSLLPMLVTTRAERAPFEKDELTWRCFKRLSDPSLTDAEPVLRSYLDAGDELQRLELAESVATLIRTYANWRPEWLSTWQTGARVLDLAGSRHESWQARLWQALSQDLGIGTVHPMALFREEVLQRSVGDPSLCSLPARVHLFCIDELPPLALGVVEALAHHMDLDWYALNPSEAFWFDTVSPRRLARLQQLGRAEHAEIGHVLLATMAARSRTHLGRLIELDPAMTTDHFDVVEPARDSVLSALQASILHLDEPALGAWADLADDPHIEVHACHSMTRELEVLHDRLLSHFERSPDLNPGDVLVVVPKIEDAAPLIDAVFGTRRASGSLPYRITGSRLADDDAALRCLLLAITEVNGEWTIGKALELLAEPIVQNRFGLDDDDVVRLHRWLAASGAHRGLDTLEDAPIAEGAHPSLPSSLERLILGFSLPDDSSEPLGPVTPITAAEGSHVDILAAWGEYLEAIKQFVALAKKALSAADWQSQLLALAGRLMSDTAPFDADWLALQSGLAEVCSKLSDILGDQHISLRVLRHALKDQLAGRSAAAIPTGSITFASFHALHPLPFKLVAALGLNDGVVPPRSHAVEHDLLRVASREGDPSPSDAARERFLGLILSSRDRLHLSYTGRSIKDNSVLLPSSLITELLDWLAPRLAAAPYGPAELSAAQDALFVEQPLQPFAATLFDPAADARRRSHEGSWMPPSSAAPAKTSSDPAARLVQADPSDDSDNDFASDAGSDHISGLPFFTAPLPAVEPPTSITLDTLASFIAHPVRYLLRRRLQIDTWLTDELPSDDEPDVGPASRDRQLATFAVQRLLAGDPLRKVEHALRHHPRMPYGSQAVHAARRLAAEHRELAADVLKFRSDAVDDLHIDLPLAGSHGLIQLQGRLHGLVRTAGIQAGLLDWRGSEPTASDTLRFWVHHLALCAAQPTPTVEGAAAPAVRSRLLYANGALGFVDCANARALLADLVDCFMKGQAEPLKFFPKTSRALAAALPTEQILQCWEGRNGRPGEREDPAIALAFRSHFDCLAAEFETLANRIWKPLLDHLRASEGSR